MESPRDLKKSSNQFHLAYLRDRLSMTSKTPDAQEDLLFTVESANRTLPLVRAIVQDLTRLYQQVVDRRGRLDTLRKEGIEVTDTNGLYAEELAEIEKDLDRDGRELERFLSELDDLGVASRNGIHGVVGYPAMIDGRLIELCWVLGEDEVAFYHEVGADPDERQPLAAIGV